MNQSNIELKASWYQQLRTNSSVQVVHKPNLLPTSVDEAYAIQRQVILNLRRHVSGWKLGGTNAKTIEAFACSEPYFGPLFDNKTFIHASEVDTTGLLEVKGEAELVFKLSSKVEFLTHDIALNINDLISEVAPAIEMPSAIFSDMKSGGVKLLIADLCGTGALVLGDFMPFSDFESLNNLNISISQNQAVLTTGNTHNILPDHCEVLRAFFRLALKHGVKLKEGQLIASGGCTSCVPFSLNHAVNVEFEGFNHFSFNLKTSKSHS